MALRAILPVAGEGTRLRPHTYVVPKALVTVADKPIIGHIIDSLREAGVGELVLIIGPRGERIVEYVQSSSPDLQVRWILQEEAAGLGHAIWCARQYLDGSPVLIVLGDTIVELEWAELFRCPDNVVGVHPVSDPRRFGVVLTHEGRVSGFIEKPQEAVSNLALVGLYLIRASQQLRDALEELLRQDIRTRGEYQLTDALELMRQRGVSFYPFSVQAWYDCGKLETLLQTNRYLLARRGGPLQREGCVIIPPVYVAPTAHLEHSIIGPYVSIGSGAIVRESVVRNAIVQAGARVEAVLLEDSVVGANAIVQGYFHRLNLSDDSEVIIGR